MRAVPSFWYYRAMRSQSSEYFDNLIKRGSTCKLPISTDMDSEDILADSFELLGETRPDPAEVGVVRYGKIKLTVAAKEGKANTLLADAVFSPSLFLAEQIQSRHIDLEGKTVLELGSGAALPLLLAATLDSPPSLITLSDYPDKTILDNLHRNLGANRIHIRPSCQVKAIGYAWGTDTEPLLSIVKEYQGHSDGYDVLILSDLLHFDSSHSDILSTVVKTLARSPQARVYVAAGLYTREPVREAFLRAGENVEIEWAPMENDGTWQGETDVRSDGVPWSREDLSVRKSNVVAWVGKWRDGKS